MDKKLLKQNPFYLSDEQVMWVSDTLAGLSDQQKVGQLFCVLGDANTPEGLADLVENWGVGGVLFRPGPKEVIGDKYASLHD